MAWRRHKLNAESAQVEHHGIERIKVRLASVAPTCADLSEFERAAEDPIGLFSQTARQPQRFSFGQDQIIPTAGRELILRGETDRSFGACVGALGAEQTAAKIDLQISATGNRICRASIHATRAARRASCVIQNG